MMSEGPQPKVMPGASTSTADAAIAIEIALFANIPVALWGAPGTGKTSLLRSIAQKMDWPLYTTTAAIHAPTDFTGLSFLSGGTLTAHTMRAPLEWAVTLAEEAAKHAGNGLVFFDDLAYAPLGVQNALLQIVLERRVDQFQLPAGVRCAAALDPVALVPNAVVALTAPLANRMVHLAWSPNGSWWVAGFRSGWPLERRAFPQDWENSLPAARNRVADFIEQRPELLNREPDDGDAQSGPWPSGRTWDMLSRLLAACDAVGAGAQARRLLAVGAVGTEAGKAYLNWERAADTSTIRKG
ncbi:MAG TPA: ATP-binding protein [bacterium]|nr:ATP-binding protein [bacterium]